MKQLALLLILCSFILAGCSTNSINEAKATINNVNQLIEETEQTLNNLSEEATSIVDTSLDDVLQAVTELNIDDEVGTSQTQTSANDTKTVTTPEEYDYVLTFPSNRYPETALHIFGAIEQGHSDVCTIDREGADDNRKESLKGLMTIEGFDRDEWPMAMCAEGGAGASVAYISASDNRGAGSWVGNELSQYENGERVLFIVEKPTELFPTHTEPEVSPNAETDASTNEAENIVYNSCAEVRAANAAPIKKGEPGYSSKLDRDGDGIACEV